MSERPLASVVAQLVANGYSPLPIRPDGKMPGVYARREWFIMREWQRFCAAQATAFEQRQWATWPDSNVGLACGFGGLIAFDIDRDELVDEIKAVLPPGYIGKRGRKGETLFYRTSAAIPSRGYKIDKLSVMDLISSGKQTVIPPSIHPDTHEPYHWTTERTLLDTPIGELPEVDERHVEAIVEVFRRYGYEPEPVRLEVEACGGFDDRSGGTEFYREMNERALANLHAWVPKLGLQNIKRERDHYRAAAEWRPSNSNKPLMKRTRHVAINPKGIIDWGDGDKAYTAIDLVMVVFGLAQYQVDKAAVWLGECLGYDFSPKMVLNRNRGAKPAPAGDEPEPDSDGTGMSEAEFEELTRLSAPAAPAPPPAVADPVRFNPVTGEVYEPLPEIDARQYNHPESYMDALTHVPGLLGEFVDWIDDTSEMPSRSLAFAIALSFMGTLAGRNYKSPTNLRTNFYTLALAGAGYGKEHAQTCIKMICKEGNLKNYLGGSDIASGPAITNMVESQPSVVWIIDEIGKFLRKITDPRNTQAEAMRSVLLQYFSKARSSFGGADKAAEKGREVLCPNVSLSGCSTPTDFWSACRSGLIHEGLLPRFMIFKVGEDFVDLRDETPRKLDDGIPAGMVDRFKMLAERKVGGNMNNVPGSGVSEALLAPWGPGAEELYKKTRKAYHRQVYDLGATPEAAILKRTAEHGHKIALLIAVGIDAFKPIITRDILARGFAIAEACAQSMISQISGRVADNERQREHLEVRRIIADAGDRGITLTDLARKINGVMESKRRDDILRTLEQDEKSIVLRLSQNPNGGRKTSRYFIADGDFA